MLQMEHHTHCNSRTENHNMPESQPTAERAQKIAPQVRPCSNLPAQAICARRAQSRREKEISKAFKPIPRQHVLI